MQWSGSRELCSTKRARQKPVRVLKNPPCFDGRGEIASRLIFIRRPREATSHPPAYELFGHPPARDRPKPLADRRDGKGSLC